MVAAICFIADLEVIAKDADILSERLRPDMEGRRLGHLFLVEERQRGVVIATIAVIDRVRNPKTVLDKVEREHIVGASGIGRDVGNEVEHLAAGHLERPQMFSDGVLASDLENDWTVVSVEVVTSDLLILDI